MGLSEVLVFIWLAQSAMGQITFPLTALANCSSLPAQCDCAGEYVTCVCRDQEEELVLEQKHFSGRTEERVAVSNCANATISSRTFRSTRVQVLVLANITALTLEQHAFQLSYDRQKRFTLIMTNVTTLELPSRMFGTENEARAVTRVDVFNTPKVILVLNNSDVYMAASDVFGSIRVHDIDMFGNSIGIVQTGFLNNTVEGTINIINNNFSEVHTDAFLISNDSSLPNELHFKYNEFLGPVTHFLTASAHFNIEVCNNSFPLMLEAPWTLHAREDVVVENNNFTNLPAFGLQVSAGARISFSFNSVRVAQRQALMAVTTEPSTLLQLAQNRFSIAEETSLQLPQNLTTQAVFVRDNIFEQPCTCANTSSVISRAIGVRAPIYRIRNDERQQPWVLLSLCQTLSNPDQPYTQVSVFLSRHCETADVTTTVFLSVFGGLLIVLACCVVVAWRRLKHKHLHAVHSSSAQPPYAEGGVAWSSVTSEKQTYRTTDIREIVEKAKQMHLSNNPSASASRSYTNEVILEHNEELRGTVSYKPMPTDDEPNGVVMSNSNSSERDTNVSARDSNAPSVGTSDNLHTPNVAQQEAVTPEGYVNTVTIEGETNEAK